MANFKSYSYNCYEIFRTQGTFTWTKPADLDGSKPILVHVWGAGGTGCSYYTRTVAPNGGGGGGLAVKHITPASLGSTETITIGAPNNNSTTQSGTSSFGSHCSATGGNGGACQASNSGSNGGVAGVANYGVGGLGIGGDINRRGGTGGTGYYASTTNAGGGGGGSAPAPYGIRDGFAGGNGSTYASGGGGGIGGPGNNGNYTGGAGGGSMRRPAFSNSRPSNYTPEPGGNGLFGPGGASGTVVNCYVSYGGATGRSGTPGRGDLLISPNEIYLGGGGGSAGMWHYESTLSRTIEGTAGGPGGGGGGCGGYDNSQYGYMSPGPGGMLGGGGGATTYAPTYGRGGNAGGGGGIGYYNYYPDGDAPGGAGLVILQYARLFS